MIDKDLSRFRREFLRYLNNGQYEQAGNGALLFPKAQAVVAGVFVHDVNGLDVRVDPNLVVSEGINYILNSALNGATQIPTLYIGPFSGNVTPQAGWTGANFASNATEFTTYDEATRQEWVEVAATAGTITNSANKAQFTIATAGGTVWGAGLLSASAKNAVTGTLIAASKFAASRTLVDDDLLSIAYSLTMTSS